MGDEFAEGLAAAARILDGHGFPGMAKEIRAHIPLTHSGLRRVAEFVVEELRCADTGEEADCGDCPNCAARAMAREALK